MMYQLWVLILFLASAQGQMDKDFCGPMKQASDDPPPMIMYSPDFSMTTEVFKEGTLQVDYASLVYSNKYQILVSDLRTRMTKYKNYIFPALDVMKTSESVAGQDTKCTSSPLEGSTLGHDFNIARDSKTNKLVLPKMRYHLALSSATQPVYAGLETVRGIPARRWTFCAYQNWTGDTILADLYYSNKFQMPGSTVNVPLMLKTNVKDKSGKEEKYRYDYTKYEDHVHPKDKSLEVPSSLYCDDAPIANDSIPIPPWSFHFQGVQKDLGNINQLPRPQPYLRFVKETYSGFIGYKLYVRDMDEVSTDDGLPKIQKRLVHDYVAGVQYDLDLSRGSCTPGKIEIGSDDFLQQPDGFVKEKSPKEFFSLQNNQYEYVGKHYNFDREIETEVYTSLQNRQKDPVQITWWFASKDFLKDMGYKATTMMPLRYQEVKKNSGETKLIDIFQFSNTPTIDQLFPDISSCFDSSKEKYIQIVVTGRYSRVYLDNPTNFLAAFNTAIMQASGVVDLLRIARVTVEPADKDSTLVSFTLLDKPGLFGNGDNSIDERSVDEVWKAIKTSLDKKTFAMTVHNQFGTNKLKAISYKQGLLNPNAFNVVKDSSASSSKTFSSSSMGFVAIGMLVLGFVFGFGVMLGMKKYKNKVPNINMHELGNRT